DGAFALVHCFSVIEHVESVERAVGEMVRVTRPGGALYVHTPNAWSLFEGHYKIFWIPFLPAPLARVYLRVRGRPTPYLAPRGRRVDERRVGGGARAPRPPRDRGHAGLRRVAARGARRRARRAAAVLREAPTRTAGGRLAAAQEPALPRLGRALDAPRGGGGGRRSRPRAEPGR